MREFGKNQGQKEFAYTKPANTYKSQLGIVGYRANSPERIAILFITHALIALENHARFILANHDRTNAFESKYLILLWKVIGLAVIGY